MNIKLFAEKVISEHSFSLKSFAEARDTITIGDKFIEYDRLSLIIYNHNLSTDEYHNFSRELRNLWDPGTIEKQKIRKEYCTLFAFAQENNEIFTANIQKTERPDFVVTLQNEMKCGVEITELTTPRDKVLDSIMNEYSGSNLDAEKIKKNAINKHGEKANIYTFTKHDDTLIGHSGTFCVKTHKNMFVQNITKKYNKYKDVIDFFDRFIILCDARYGIEVTSQCDAEDIFDLLPNELSHGNLEIIIMALVDNKTKCFSKETI